MSIDINKNGITYFLALRRAAPEMLELLKRAANIMASLERLLDTALLGQESVQKSTWERELSSLLNKIEGGEE